MVDVVVHKSKQDSPSLPRGGLQNCGREQFAAGGKRRTVSRNQPEHVAILPVLFQLTQPKYAVPRMDGKNPSRAQGDPLHPSRFGSSMQIGGRAREPAHWFHNAVRSHRHAMRSVARIAKADVPGQRPAAKNHDRNRTGKPAAAPSTSQLRTALRLIGFAECVVRGTRSCMRILLGQLYFPGGPTSLELVSFPQSSGYSVGRGGLVCIGREGNLARRPRHSS
jgi:hypothetical protein